MGEMYQIDAVLFAVDGPHLGALLAVVYHDLIVFAAGDQGFAVRREVDAVYLVGVLAKHLRDLEAPHHLVHQFHLHLGGDLSLLLGHECYC